VSPAKAPPAPPPVTNTAMGQAHVGVQGVVYGDVRYEVHGEDPPKKKYAVAKNNIAGNMPRRAEELIKEVVAAGFTADDLAYYWTIAILSDRTFDQIGTEQLADLRRAYELSANDPADGWHDALTIVSRLVDCLLDEETHGRLDRVTFDALIEAYERLPEARRDEIRRHLNLILTGGIEESLADQSAEEVRARRMESNRRKRVWKFFEPVPEEPRSKPPEEPTLDPFPRMLLIGAAVMGGAGLALAFVLVAKGDGTAALIAGLLVGVGGWAFAFYGPELFPARFSTPPPAPSEFSAYVRRTVERQFAANAPEAAPEKSRWSRETSKIKKVLTREIVDLYSDPEVPPGGLEWLIKWHAKQSARRWAAGELEEEQDTSQFGVLGAMGLGLGALVALVEMLQVQVRITGVAVTWLVFGAILLLASRGDVYLVRRRTYPAEKAAFDKRLTGERSAYEKWSTKLADRPTDDEMARWLDYDKIYLKSLAMNQYGLAKKDVIAHAILTEAADNTRRARVPNGRERYTAYVVWVFLLTEAGVRQVSLRLDFASGLARDQMRMTFRYDAIASARVIETGVWFDDGHRQVILPKADGRKDEKNGKDKKDDDSTSKISFHQVFRLSLVDGQDIEIVVASFNEIFDTDEGDAKPPPVSDTAELTGALRILEAVAADGPTWIEVAKARHRKLLNDDRASWSANSRADGSPLETTH
jgi:hypothetical protein